MVTHSKLTMDLYERANMIVASVPCPPLPMLGSKAENAEETVFISHDLLRTTFLNIMTCSSESDRRRHIEKTEEADAELARQMMVDGVDEYETFCTYMRQLLQIHTAVGKDIRFKGPDYVAVNDKVHKTACSHLRGQDHIYAFTGAYTNYNNMQYKDIVNVYARRLKE
jgi:hypothetical protein